MNESTGGSRSDFVFEFQDLGFEFRVWGFRGLGF